MDHRQGMRRPVLALVELELADGGNAAGLLYNLSADGMFIISRQAPAINECVEVRVPRQGGEPVRLSGFVVHRGRHGFGILFRRLNPVAGWFVQSCLEVPSERAPGRQQRVH